MTRFLLFLLTLCFLSAPATAQFGRLGKLADKAQGVLKGEDPLNQDEVGAALKQALDQGVHQAVTKLSAEDGYLQSPYKILLPPEAQTVIQKVSALPGFGDVEQDLTIRINRAAELAARQATPIFVNAIKGLSFQDALQLLTGENDAATRYLEGNTSTALTAAFQPEIRKALDEVNANELWHRVVSAYNKIPFVKKTEPELDVYVTGRALDGMFGLIEVKETELRQNPALRNTELLRKVFARQDN